MKQYITIKDDKGNEHTFFKLDELIEYLNSFQLSFLPDNFNFKINKEEK